MTTLVRIDSAMPVPYRSPTDHAWRLRAAGLLDVPLIFELIMEGSQAGAFTDHHLSHTGSPRLLFSLLGRIAAQRFLPDRARGGWQVIEGASGEPVGCLQTRQPRDASQPWDLALLSIIEAHRNRGLGTQVVEHLLAELPPDRVLRVHCTRYARAMQHILKKERFQRRRDVVAPHMEEYTSRPSPLAARDGFVTK